MKVWLLQLLEKGKSDNVGKKIDAQAEPGGQSRQKGKSKMVKTVLSPLMGDEYDPDVLLEMEDLYQYYKTWGCTEFAVLDALSLEYYGRIELH